MIQSLTVCFPEETKEVCWEDCGQYGVGVPDTEGGAGGGDGASVDKDEDQDGDHAQDQVLHRQADTQHLGQVGHLLTGES